VSINPSELAAKLAQGRGLAADVRSALRVVEGVPDAAPSPSGVPLPQFPPGAIVSPELAAQIAREIGDRLAQRVNIQPRPFSVGTAATRILVAEYRTYIFIQNTHPTQFLYVGIGYEPNNTIGMTIGPNGYYEPLRVPQNEIWLLGSGAGTTGILLYATAYAQ